MRPFNIVTKPELLELAKQTFADAMALMQRKNDDYSTRQSNDDALKNFRGIETLGITTTENGVFVRLFDKVNRIANFLQTGVLSVEDEKIDDTIQDAINYLVILKAAIKSVRDT